MSAGKEFIVRSRFPSATVTRVPLIERPTVQGQWVPENRDKALRYQFKNARLVLHHGANVLTEEPSRWLRDGEQQGVARDEVEAFKARRDWGRDYWEEGFPPGTLLPRPQDFRRDLARATGHADIARVEDMLREETATHNRPELVQLAEEALLALRETLGDLGDPDASENEENAWHPDDTNDRLYAIAESRGLDVKKSDNKQTLIDALRADDETRAG